MRTIIIIAFLLLIAYTWRNLYLWDAPWWVWVALTGQHLIVLSILAGLIYNYNKLFNNKNKCHE